MPARTSVSTARGVRYWPLNWSQTVNAVSTASFSRSTSSISIQPLRGRQGGVPALLSIRHKRCAALTWRDAEVSDMESGGKRACSRAVTQAAARAAVAEVRPSGLARVRKAFAIGRHFPAVVAECFLGGCERRQPKELGLQGQC